VAQAEAKIVEAQEAAAAQVVTKAKNATSALNATVDVLVDVALKTAQFDVFRTLNPHMADRERILCDTERRKAMRADMSSQLDAAREKPDPIDVVEGLIQDYDVAIEIDARLRQEARKKVGTDIHLPSDVLQLLDASEASMHASERTNTQEALREGLHLGAGVAALLAHYDSAKASEATQAEHDKTQPQRRRSMADRDELTYVPPLPPPAPPKEAAIVLSLDERVRVQKIVDGLLSESMLRDLSKREIEQVKVMSSVLADQEDDASLQKDKDVVMCLTEKEYAIAQGVARQMTRTGHVRQLSEKETLHLELVNAIITLLPPRREGDFHFPILTPRQHAVAERMRDDMEVLENTRPLSYGERETQTRIESLLQHQTRDVILLSRHFYVPASEKNSKKKHKDEDTIGDEIVSGDDDPFEGVYEGEIKSGDDVDNMDEVVANIDGRAYRGSWSKLAIDAVRVLERKMQKLGRARALTVFEMDQLHCMTEALAKQPLAVAAQLKIAAEKGVEIKPLAVRAEEKNLRGQVQLNEKSMSRPLTFEEQRTLKRTYQRLALSKSAKEAIEAVRKAKERAELTLEGGKDEEAVFDDEKMQSSEELSKAEAYAERFGIVTAKGVQYETRRAEMEANKFDTLSAAQFLYSLRLGTHTYTYTALTSKTESESDDRIRMKAHHRQQLMKRENEVRAQRRAKEAIGIAERATRARDTQQQQREQVFAANMKLITKFEGDADSDALASSLKALGEQLSAPPADAVPLPQKPNAETWLLQRIAALEDARLASKRNDETEDVRFTEQRRWLDLQESVDNGTDDVALQMFKDAERRRKAETASEKAAAVAAEAKAEEKLAALAAAKKAAQDEIEQRAAEEIARIAEVQRLEKSRQMLAKIISDGDHAKYLDAMAALMNAGESAGNDSQVFPAENVGPHAVFMRLSCRNLPTMHEFTNVMLAVYAIDAKTGQVRLGANACTGFNTHTHTYTHVSFSLFHSIPFLSFLISPGGIQTAFFLGCADYVRCMCTHTHESSIPLFPFRISPGGICGADGHLSGQCRLRPIQHANHGVPLPRRSRAAVAFRRL
jgi:hypothetical protein